MQRARQARRRVNWAKPTDRAKRGTKYHVLVASDGIPLAALPSAANVHDTMLFPALLRRALVVCAAIARLYADAENGRSATWSGAVMCSASNDAVRMTAGHDEFRGSGPNHLAAQFVPWPSRVFPIPA